MELNMDNETIPPVDRTKRCMISGNPESPDHREIDPRTGMQKDYVILCPDERKKGFVGLSLAETYARDPGFYGGTFCCYCRAHFPLDQFVWKGTDEKVGS